MNQKGFANIVLIVLVIILVGATGYFIVKQFVPTKMIIVGVKTNPPWQVMGGLSPEKHKELEVAIVEATDKVLNDLNKNMYGHVGLIRFKYIPSFAITVSENAYKYLLKHPLVTGVEGDSLASTHGSSTQNNSVLGGPMLPQ